MEDSCTHTINWKIFELKIFRKIKYRAKKKFVVTGGLKFFNMRARWPKGDIMNSTTCERSSVEELGRDCCIRGYHIYKEMWEAAAGEVL